MQSALQTCQDLFSASTTVPHQPGWCDCRHSTTAPLRSSHTSKQVEREW